MGVVYKARDTRLDRSVALKFLPPRLSESEQSRTRLLQEARAASALNHPNICTIYGIEEHNGSLFIAMEYLEGVTLKRMINGSPLPIDQIVNIGSQIADGLKAAGDRGLIHRDIKSENIIVTPDNRAKIMDFGLAKVGGDAGTTKAGTTVGTLSYMAPEQIMGEEVDARADLWSFGVVLYEMLTGKLPFRGEHEAAVMYEILNQEPPPLTASRSDVPGHFQQLVSALLQKDRNKRTVAPAEIIEGLKTPQASDAHEDSEKSIAVLYFDNMSSEKDSEYFCAGITEDIITDLSRIKELKVVSRFDVMPFRNKEANTRQVGEALKVNYILEGSVRKAGNKIRITAQLIDVENGFHAWAERFDRLVEDIFDVQMEVSQKIAEALKITLSESEKASLAQKPTNDMRAYDFYMRGREFLSKRGRKNTEKAIPMFENALAIDPNFVSAYSELASSYSYMYIWYDGDPSWLAKTISLNERALALDPNSVDTLFGSGMIYFHQKRFGEAKRTLEKVIKLNPDFYEAFRWLGIISDITQSYDEAIEYYKRCASLKPFSEEPWMHLDMTFRRKGNLEASKDAVKTLLKLGQAKLDVNPDDAITISRMATAYVRLGQPEKGLEAIRMILKVDPTDGLALYNAACTYADLGRKEETLSCLRGALNAGYKGVLEWVKSDPDFDSMIENPEFKALLAEFG